MSDNLKDLESRLRDISCPICAEQSFHVDPRTDKSGDIHKAQCLKCRYSFSVYTDVGLYLESQPDMPVWFRSVTCPACERQGVTLHSRVQASVRDSYYLVTCSNCTHPFAERAWMDSYE